LLTDCTGADNNSGSLDTSIPKVCHLIIFRISPSSWRVFSALSGVHRQLRRVRRSLARSADAYRTCPSARLHSTRSAGALKGSSFAPLQARCCTRGRWPGRHACKFAFPLARNLRTVLAVETGQCCAAGSSDIGAHPHTHGCLDTWLANLRVGAFRRERATLRVQNEALKVNVFLGDRTLSSFGGCRGCWRCHPQWARYWLRRALPLARRTGWHSLRKHS
jgi:hypothetical protein